MIRLIGSPHLTKPLSEVVSLPKYIRVVDFEAPAVGSFRDSVYSALEAGHPVIPIVIDSPGGYAASLLAMVDIIENAKQSAVIATIAEGRAASCGAILLTCGTPGYRYVTPSASVMVHRGNAGSGGNIPDLVSGTKDRQREEAQVFRILDKNTGHKSGHFAALLKARENTDWVMTPQAAVKNGLADKVGSPTYIVKVGVDFGFE